MARMNAIMAHLRRNSPAELAGWKVQQAVDYQNSAATGLPGANVLEYRLENGASLMIRPSGTEPKIKLYLSAVGASRAEADGINARLAEAARTLLR